MEFCKNCKKILIPKNSKLECSCGYKKELSTKDIKNQYNFKGETLPENEIILKKDNNVTLPTKKITCYKCGGKKGYWWTVQTRSADEAPTYFIRCAKCGNTWRQSN